LRPPLHIDASNPLCEQVSSPTTLPNARSASLALLADDIEMGDEDFDLEFVGMDESLSESNKATSRRLPKRRPPHSRSSWIDQV